MIEKIETDDRLSNEAKETKIDAVAALKEIVEERISSLDEDEDVLEMIEELLE